MLFRDFVKQRFLSFLISTKYIAPKKKSKLKFYFIHNY